MKRGLILSDLHCGAMGGLAPPGYRVDWLSDSQGVFWDWFTSSLASYGPFDFLIGAGDLTDGEGKKGTLGTVITDVGKQADAACACLRATGVDPARMYLVRGTPFHTNGTTEYEDAIADELGASIRDVQKLEVEGWKIHTRHVVGRSDISYGQGTPLLKELARMEHEAFLEEKDAPDIIIRGHVHYAASVNRDGRLALAAPCLCLPIDSANGRRYTAWYYTVGFGVLELEEGREPVYYPVIMPIRLVHDEGYKCVKW
jgi:predicted phosphodiesterase